MQTIVTCGVFQNVVSFQVGDDDGFNRNSNSLSSLNFHDTLAKFEFNVLLWGIEKWIHAFPKDIGAKVNAIDEAGN